MSVRKGSDVIILDLEDAKKLVEAYRLLCFSKKTMLKLAEAHCLYVFDQLVPIVREKETE